MKKYLLMLPLIFALNIAFGQSYWNGYISNHTSINVIGGYHYPDLKKFNEYFQNNYSLDFGKEIKMAGIDYTAYSVMTRGGGINDMHLSYLQFMPVKLSISDSLNFTLGGCNVSFLMFGKDLFYKSKYFDLIYGVGFNAGRYKLLRNDLSVSVETLKYTNPFFAPKITIEPRVILGSVMIGIRGEYQYDITYSGWRNKTEVFPDLPEVKKNGFGIQGVVGYNIPYKERGTTGYSVVESDTLDYMPDTLIYSDDEYFGLDFLYGYYIPNLKSLNSQLELDHSIAFNHFYSVVGSEFAYGDDFVGFRTSFLKINKAELKLNDSINLSLKGYFIGFGAGIDFFMSNKSFDLIGGIGANVGRLVLTRNSAMSGSLKYTNPFFAPKLILEPRVNIGVLTLGVRAEYMYDITYSGWREEVYSAPNFGSAKASGFNVTGIAGLNF